MVIELAKELLYSGVPEQVIELYAAYYDLILKRDNIQVSFPRYFAYSLIHLLIYSEYDHRS